MVLVGQNKRISHTKVNKSVFVCNFSKINLLIFFRFLVAIPLAFQEAFSSETHFIETIILCLMNQYNKGASRNAGKCNWIIIFGFFVLILSKQ